MNVLQAYSAGVVHAILMAAALLVLLFDAVTRGGGDDLDDLD